MSTLTLVQFAQAIADNKKFLFVDLGEYHEVDAETAVRYWVDFPGQVSIKPTLKPVDMSGFVDSGIDCEFDDSECFQIRNIGRLSIPELNSDYPFRYRMVGRSRYKFVRPRMNHWMSHKNCTLKGNSLQMMLMDAGFGSTMSESGEFKINGLHADRCWPWEGR